MTEFLTFQQRKILKEQAENLLQWGETRIEDIWLREAEKYNKEIKCKRDATLVYNNVLKRINEIRMLPTDYQNFTSENSNEYFKIEFINAPEVIIGRCPCPSEDKVLRCCNLATLDAVQQCVFDCAYCSIQSFYHEGKIRVIKNLKEVLFSDNFRKMIDENEIWHIGTGQSSDSLMFGNDYDTISALEEYCYHNENVIIELKTKSSRTDWIKDEHPLNLIPTWSLNAKTIVDKEEHNTASLIGRIKAAEKAINEGYFSGFHIHPMVYFDGYKTEYRDLVHMLTDYIDPKKILMVSIGTLTFTKNVLKKIRLRNFKTKITCMPLSEIAGKYSYPNETKKEMFSYLYSLFPQNWKDNVFFYLCMEDSSLWQPCLNKSYASNSEFEEDMKKQYFGKIYASKRLENNMETII